MRVPKYQWVMVNHTTGVVCQVCKPMTKYKAMQRFLDHLSSLDEFELVKSLSDVKPMEVN